MCFGAIIDKISLSLMIIYYMIDVMSAQIRCTYKGCLNFSSPANIPIQPMNLTMTSSLNFPNDT